MKFYYHMRVTYLGRSLYNKEKLHKVHFVGKSTTYLVIGAPSIFDAKLYAEALMNFKKETGEYYYNKKLAHG